MWLALVIAVAVTAAVIAVSLSALLSRDQDSGSNAGQTTSGQTTSGSGPEADQTSAEYADAFEGGQTGARTVGVLDGEDFCRQIMEQYVINNGIPSKQMLADLNAGCRDGWKSIRPEDDSIKP